MLNFVDNSFDIERLANYNLVIQINASALSFCVYDKELKKHVVLKDCYYREYPLEIGELTIEVGRLLKSEPIIRYFRKCKCIYVSPVSTFIPEEIFAEENLSDYLNFISPMMDLDEIHFQKIEEINAYLLYKIYTPLVVSIKSNFDIVEFYNQNHMVYKHASEILEDDSIHLDFNGKSMSVMAFKNKNFIFSNTFNVKSEEDILYYLGAVATESELKQATKVYLSGDIERDSIKKVYSYFPNIMPKENNRISLLVNKDSAYRLYNLLYLSECE